MIEGEHYDYKFVHTGLQPTAYFKWFIQSCADTSIRSSTLLG